VNELAFEVVHVPTAEVTALAGDVVAVYRAAFGEPPYRYGEAQVREFQQEVFARHVRREGFRLVVARVAGRVVGFAYGYTGQRGQWWTDVVARAMPEEVVREWLGGHFAFVELAVAPEFQRCGIGTALHDALLEGLSHPRALLSALDAPTPALRLYGRKGWRVLVRGLRFPGSDSTYLILGFDLTQRGIR
jgi:ribosomal protein S18 acetylase RimI-like enzyme